LFVKTTKYTNKLNTSIQASINMNRYTPRNSSEFEARQICFEFGKRARRIAREVAATIKKAGKWLVKALNPAISFKKPHQLVLELDAIAQMPLFDMRSACTSH
jgi:hypothetical protein